MEFTKAQQEAISYGDGHLQLIACAGSGKTEVVARRVVHLLQKGAKPSEIIAFTFTEKAAAELKERIASRVRESLGPLPGMAEMFVGTLHAWCLDLLREAGSEYQKYGLLNEVQQHLFIDRNSKKSGLTECADLSGKRLKRYVSTGLYLSALSIMREDVPIEGALDDCSLVAGLEAYRNLLEERCYFDYTAILDKALEELVDNQELQARLEGRISHVIVDEYQDLNPVQEGIVWQLSSLGAVICVVGDDDQTIYQWRGSDVSHILEFAKRYASAGGKQRAVKQVRLEENFRSSPAVVELARDFIAQNTNRLPKAMKATDAQPYEVGDIVAQAFDTPEEEAEYVARTVRSLRGVAFNDRGATRGLSWSDMAILLRSVKKGAPAIVKALQDAGIPFVVVGMNNLFGTAEAEAARQTFYYVAGQPGITESSLRDAWLDAELGDIAIDVAVSRLRKMRGEMMATTEPKFSFYSIQRTFMNFLEDLGLREESIPDERGEVVFYNLGKFSQLISDFETIHYHSKPAEKYEAFAGFLRHGAEESYPEGAASNQYASPDAVRIMTVHQAKGLEWPVVMLPALGQNRFPSAGVGGMSVWHLLPAGAFQNSTRYKGGIEDERRLFYVALTRSRKFLHLTWAADGTKGRYTKPGEFFNWVLGSRQVKRKAQTYSDRASAVPTPRSSIANVVLTFSDLKYFFECPYQFKLRILYGFNAPLHEALGYGKSLHDILSEVHARALAGRPPTSGEVDQLVARHLHVPYAYPALREKLTASAERVVRNYLQDNAPRWDQIEFAEKAIELQLGDGVSVVGRIDLVRRKDTDEVTIVDLKSNDRSQAESLTEDQLHIYALGYKELTDRDADYVETYDLDGRKPTRRPVDEDFIDDVVAKVKGAADALRNGHFPEKPTPRRSSDRATTCKQCDYCRLCPTGTRLTAEA